ncbi:MAG: ATP-binding protein [Nitrospiria bacterium]
MAINLLTVSVLMTLLCAGLVFNEYLNFKKSSIESLTIQARMIANNSTAAVSFNDSKAAKEILSSMAISSNIIYAIIYKDGKVFASYQREIERKNLPGPPPNGNENHFRLNGLDLSQLIKLKGETLGVLSIRSDLSRMYFNFILYAVVVSLILLGSLIGAFLLLSRFQKVITTPIFNLAGLIDLLSKEKDFTRRARVEGGTEFVTLGKGFNAMLEQIQNRESELETNRKDLYRTNQELKQELSKRKEAEDELKLQSEIVNNMAGGTLLFGSSSGLIVHTNPRLNQMFGYEPGELIGKHISILNAAGSNTPEETAKNIINTLEKNNTWSGEIKSRRKNGSIFWTFGNISTFNHPLYGKVWVEVKTDITEKRKMEEELVKVQKLESLGLLAGGIAHDFNNILTGILGNISLAKTWINPKNPSFERLGEAEKASQRAADLARQLLTFAKGGAPIKRTTTIQEILENSVNFVLRGSNIVSEFSIQNGLWPVDVDEGQIAQVIQNLAINAQQAMPDGGLVNVRAGNITIGDKTKINGLSLRNGQYVEISVQDHGIGIPKDLLSKIFDPYFTTKEKGSGLGLAISHSIIQKHDGLINVKSELEMGTTFSLFLPASPRAGVSHDLNKEEIIRGEGKVLIMDDEQSVLDVACEMLKFLGYETDFALSGTSAIEKYQKAQDCGHPFDLVITDLTIPGDIGGIEVAKRLKMIGIRCEDYCVQRILERSCHSEF